MRAKTFVAPLSILVAVSLSPLARAQDEYSLTIKDHRFDPAELRVPPGKKLKLAIRNLDDTPEEFESYELNREKVIGAGQSVSVYIGPLEPGRYAFFGEFHEDTAKGVIVVE